MVIHDMAARGFQAAAEAYEQGRPDYPLEGTDALFEALKLKPGSAVVDLGAGTGKFTRLLISTGAKIVAIEPVEKMRRTFSEQLPGIEIQDGAAEAIPLPASSADAIVAAQAFHWFANEQALGEIHRVLRSKGRLGLIWNTWDMDVDWVRDLVALIDRHAADAPRYTSMAWRKGLESSKLFGPLEQVRFRHTQSGDLEKLLSRIASISFVAILPEGTRKQLLSEVRARVTAHPALRGKDAYPLPYVTDVYWTARQ